jgi:hypothetical protein
MPKAQTVNGISTKKRVVMTMEMCSRTSSHFGASGPSGEQLGKRKAYMRLARTQAVSMLI